MASAMKQIDQRLQPTQMWVTPTLSYRGSVKDILKSGTGKFSITAADPGEMRCEKPHVSQCS